MLIYQRFNTIDNQQKIKKSPARGQQPLDISRLNAVFVVSLSFKAEPAYQLLTYHFLPCTHQSNMNTC